MKTILLLGAGTQGLAVSRDLVTNGFRVVMLCESKHNYGDDSKLLSKIFYETASITSSQYLDKVLDIIRNEKIDAIIPMGDTSAKFLSQYKDELKPIVSFEMPKLSDFDRGYDKDSLMKLCAEKGYPHPQTYHIDNIDFLDEAALQFPLLIKPNQTCGGRGMTLVKSLQELKSKYPDVVTKYGDCHLQRFINPGGRQVEVQLYVNANGELLYSSVISKFRWYPEKGGSSCCAESVENPQIVSILHRLLKDLNWVGFADFDTIEDPETHELLIMELNPRVPACVKTAIVSGIPWGTIIASEYIGFPHLNINYTPGKVLKHLGFEILWFIKSRNRFNTKPSILKLFGNNIYYQDLDGWNLKPFILGTFKNIRHLLSRKYRNEKTIQS